MTTDERKKQMDYWMEHSSELTVEEMLLDSQAKLLDKEERPEVLAMLPSYKDKDIIELGAGIGRFTGELAKHAHHVIAMDFMKHVIEKNKEINKHHKNVDFWCADVTTELDIAPASADLVFSNWLLMYLSDEEVKQLARRMLNWVKIGGHLFFRESCFHQSGDHKRKNNPTHYREPRYYNKIFEEVFNKEEDGTYSRWRLVLCKCVGAYVRAKKNQNQICWIWTKVSCECPDETDFQKFLDSVQYTETGILRYERIFGEGFVSTGGLDTTKEFVEILNLQAGQKVLDVGCGIGGGDFYMAEEFNVEVLGLDLSVNMASIALERAIGRQCAVEFEVGDVTMVEFPNCSFDVIYSRDTILHIQDKPSLFERFYGWLKPGGRILITDYCKSELPPSQEFESYIKQRGYDLHDVQRYGQMLRNAGFVDVVAEDRTDQFIEILRNELSRTENVKDEFVRDFSEEDYNAIIAGWTSKLKRCGAGEQKWGLFYGCKPL